MSISIPSITDSIQCETVENVVEMCSLCVTRVTNLQCLLSSYMICIQRCTFFVVSNSTVYVYRAKCCYWSWMLTLCHWSHGFLAECCLFLFFSQEAIRDVHVKGIMYRAVEADIGNLLWFISTFFELIEKKLYGHIWVVANTKNWFRNSEGVI